MRQFNALKSRAIRFIARNRFDLRRLRSASSRTLATAAIAPTLLAVFALVFWRASLPHSPAATSAVSASPHTQGKKTMSRAGQRRWIIYVDPLLDWHQRKLRKLVECSDRIFAETRNVLDHGDVEGFLDDALGLTSKAKLATNAKEWRSWIKDRYVANMVPREEICSLVDSQAQQLLADLNEIDEETLIGLGADVQIPSEGVAVPTVPEDELDQAVDRAISAIIPQLQEAALFSVGGFVTSTYAGERGYQSTRGALADHKGENTVGDKAAALAVGALVDAGVGTAIEFLAPSRDSMKLSVLSATHELHFECFGAGGVCKRHLRTLRDFVECHQDRLCTAIVTQLGIDGQWALDAYNRGISKRISSRP